MNENILAIIRCPITKEKLYPCDKKDLEKLKNSTRIDTQLNYLINESKTFLYPVSPNGYPILLPEESIDILKELKNDSLSSLKEHRSHLENVYKKINFEKTPFEVSGKSYVYLRTAVTKPLVENLISGSVLDAGGGFGFFRRFTQGCFHLNLDVSEQMLNYDNSENKILGRTENVPIHSSSFDNVVSVGSIEHCHDVNLTLNELSRCLKPKGRLLLACYSDDWPRILSGTIWAGTYYVYILEMYYMMFKKNPLLFIERVLDKLKIRKMNVKKSFGSLWGGEDQGKINIRYFNSDKLEEMLSKTGLQILKKGRCGKNFPGKLYPPKIITNRYFDSMKYGQYLFFVCEKT